MKFKEEIDVKKLLWIATIALISMNSSFAQEKGQLGINFRVNSSQSLGLTYHVSNVIAFRPAALFTLTSEERSGLRTVFNTGANPKVGIGGELTALCYLTTKEKSSPYLGISASYASLGWREKNFIDASHLVVTALAKVKEYKIAGLFGIQHSFSRRFSVYGEISFGWFRENLASLVFGEVRKTTLSLSNSGIGMLFHIH